MALSAATVTRFETKESGAIRPAAAAVVPLPRPTREPGRLLAMSREAGAIVVPPLIVLTLILLVWQIAASGPKATLPTPLRIWQDAKDLIVDPFFVLGPQDIGLGWRVLTSLQRVAIGFGLAAVVGVALGALVGQSLWAMRGLDPIFQVLRTVPPLAWLPISLAAFRDSAPSAIFVIFITAIWPVIINTAVGIRNIPQDYRNVARILRLNQAEYFWRIMVPAAAPYIFTGLADRHRPVVAGHRGGRDADRRRRHRLLHLGRLELLAALRHHRGAGLHRRHRLRPRPPGRARRPLRHARRRRSLRRQR